MLVPITPISPYPFPCFTHANLVQHAVQLYVSNLENCVVEVKHRVTESVHLLWYYGTPNALKREVGHAIDRFREKYGLEPTRAWFRTGVEIDTEDTHGLEIGYKDHVLPGHFEISAEEE